MSIKWPGPVARHRAYANRVREGAHGHLGKPEDDKSTLAGEGAVGDRRRVNPNSTDSMVTGDVCAVVVSTSSTRCGAPTAVAAYIATTASTSPD